MDTEDGRWVEVAREIIECYDYRLVNYSSFLLLPPRLCSCVCWIYSPSWRKPSTGREMGPNPPLTVTRSCSWSWRTWSPSTAFSYAGLTRETYQLLWKGESEQLGLAILLNFTLHRIFSVVIRLGILTVRHLKRLERVIIGYLEVYDGPEEEARLKTLETLKLLLQYTWPRYDSQQSGVLRGKTPPILPAELAQMYVQYKVLRTCCTDGIPSIFPYQLDFKLWKWHWQEIHSVPSGGHPIRPVRILRLLSSATVDILDLVHP